MNRGVVSTPPTSGIRAVTDDEVAHYRDHGWVILRGLVSEDLAAGLLERAKATFGADATEGLPSTEPLKTPWRDFHDIVENDDRFAAVALSPQMGENVQRLMRRDVGVVLQTNTLAVKIGTQQRSVPPSPATDFHQDGPSLPFDRAGRVTVWIALDHLTGHMGTMRYVDRSHHLGPLGNMIQGGEISGDLFELYPELNDMSVTDPPELRPGDVMAHTMYTLHDASANTTDRPRWVFIVNYIPADTVYNGAQVGSLPSRAKIEKAGIAPGDTFGGPLYPRVI